MASIESLDATSAQNPSNLPPRFEIRRLKPEHSDWAKAIVMHSNLFYSPVWPLLYPQNRLERLHEGMKTSTYLVDHQINSGMSFGVFDTEYQFKRPESQTMGGKLYWNETDTNSTGADLTEQMDFPLVSVALAYDQSEPLDHEKMGPLVGTLPLFGNFYGILAAKDQRDPESWIAKGPKEVLMRNATSTRHDYEGTGVMKKLAHFLMREAKLNGYRGIQIECLHDAVTKTWLNPPEPFRGELVSQVDFATYEEKDEKGESVLLFAPSKQVGTKIYVHL